MNGLNFEITTEPIDLLKILNNHIQELLKVLKHNFQQ